MTPIIPFPLVLDRTVGAHSEAQWAAGYREYDEKLKSVAPHAQAWVNEQVRLCFNDATPI